MLFIDQCQFTFSFTTCNIDANVNESSAESFCSAFNNQTPKPMRANLFRRVIFLMMLSAFVLSCRHEVSIENAADSPFRETVQKYIDRQVPSTDEEAKTIALVKASLDYTSIRLYTITANEDLLIADVPGYELEQGERLKALFFIQDREIIRSSLVSLTNQHEDNNVILSLVKAPFKLAGYTGKISCYTIYGSILFYNVVADGKLVTSGVLQAKRDGKRSSGRTQMCIDWYLITTYRYANGSSSTSEQYIKTTCDGDCQSARMAGIQCDGGAGSGGGSYSIVLPATGNDGDTYTVTEPNGKTTTWTFVGASHSWTISLIVLPEVVVQSEYATYSFLSSEGPALDGSLVVGPDNFLYVYDAWSATWQGSLPYEVGGPASRIPNRPAYLRCFNASQGATLTIYIDQPVPGHDDASSGLSNVGHAWISITQGGITRTFGYYPDGVAVPYSPENESVLGNDSNHVFDVSVQIQITASEFSQILNYVLNMPATYDLNTMNCVNFVVESCGAAGIALPQHPGTWRGGGGLNPGRFGQDMRNFDIPNKTETRDNDGGTAVADSGNCPS